MQKLAHPELNAGKERRNKLYYAIIDTNVLVSALLSRIHATSAPAKIMEYLYRGNLIPIYNEKIVEEYEDVLSRNKFRFNPENVRMLIDQIKKIGIHEAKAVSGECFPDLDDAVFFEVTLAFKEKNQNTYLVTGNLKHFPAKPFVVSPRQMVDILEERT